MQSRLIEQLEASIRSSPNRTEWARSMCRQASHYARQGIVDQATQAIDSVRRSFGVALEPEVASWLMLAEGILHFSNGDFPHARDRVQRAHGLAVSMHATRAAPACAAWFAHIEFNLSNFTRMAQLLEQALTEARADDHQARARASLVMADGLHFSGSFQQARPWYDATRLHATQEGDEATLSAMFHNVAAFRAANIRLAHALNEQLPEEARRATLEASSASAYDAAIGTRSLNSLIPLVSGQLLVVEGRLEEATNCLSKIAVDQLPQRLRALLFADLGWCASNLGSIDSAKDLCQSAVIALEQDIDDDDAAYAMARLSKMYQLFGDAKISADLALRAKAAFGRHRQTQQSVRNLLKNLSESITHSAK